MLSQGRVKPSSASRQSAATFLPTHKLIIEVNAAGLNRVSAPEPGTPQQAVVVDSGTTPTTTGTAPSATTTSSGGAVVQRGSRSGSSLAVAHQEFSAVSGAANASFPNRGSAVSSSSSAPPQLPQRGAASVSGVDNNNSASPSLSSPLMCGGAGVTGLQAARKGVAPMNARPVPVTSSPTGSAPSPTTLPSAPPAAAAVAVGNGSYHQLHHSHSADFSQQHQQQHNAGSGTGTSRSSDGGGGGPILSNTARHQQQQQQQQQQFRYMFDRDTNPPSSHRAGQVGSAASATAAAPTQSRTEGGGGAAASERSTSSADSSENSPTERSLTHGTSSGAQPLTNAPPLDLGTTATATGGSPRHLSSTASRVVKVDCGGLANSSGDTNDDEDDNGGSNAATTNPHRTSSSTSLRELQHPQLPAPPPSSLSLSQQNTAGTAPDSAPQSTVSSPVAPQKLAPSTGRRGSNQTATPTPPSTKGAKSQVPTVTGSVSSASSPTGKPATQIDIGPACQALSLYEAFTFDTTLKMWVVRDDVLAKCLEYIRIMGYQHPAYVRALQQAEKRQLKTPSVWCPSATIPSPITPAQPLFQPSNNSMMMGRPNVASPTVPAASKLEDKALPPTNAGPQWKLVPHEAPHKETPEGAEQLTHSDEPTLCPLFFECEESLRWLAEQEYVIGTILLTCSFEPMSSTEKRAKLKKQQQHGGSEDTNNSPGHPSSTTPPLTRRQYVPAHTHPIRYVAAHVIHNFSHWGDFKSFSAVWDAQVRIVLGVAQPSHQKTIPIPETGLVFHSEFECGNLARVQRHIQGAYNNPFVQSGVCPPGSSTNVYLLWIEGDTQSDKRLWFRFAVTGCREREPLCIRMMNIAPNSRLYRNGMKPVWRAGASQLQWTPVDDYTFHLINDERDGELSFFIVPKSSCEAIHVAFCVPYGYGDLLCHITQWHALVKRSACNIRFEERVLCRTLDERKLHLLIITSQTERIAAKQGPQQLDSRGRPIQQAGATPYSSFASGKKVVLISGRVHPGEVTASHALHGIVSFLLSHDPRAATLREHFIFFIVPMLNPDGVARGYSRLDQNGLNLNRCYNDPNPVTQPTVHSLRNVFDHLQTNFRDRFFMYLDFHSHASQQAGFAFGNHLPNSVQHWNMLFPKLIAIHSNDLFDFDTCRFSRGHMVSKDGTSRVLFGGSLIHSYTIELTHFTDFRTFGDRPSVALGSSSATAGGGSAPPENGSGPNGASGARGKHSGATVSNAGGGASGSLTASASTQPSSAIQALQSPVINGVLFQSAEVGRACVLALLDYCSIGDSSPDLVKFGGMDRAVREVKREIRGGGPQRPSSYSSQSVFKQY